MTRYVVEAWLTLLYVGYVMKKHPFSKVHELVRDTTADTRVDKERPPISWLRQAMDYGCILFYKPVLCLQRSAALTLLLRRYGYEVQMVVGARTMPFKAHAWVECAGEVVNDRPYVRDLYAEFERY